MMAMNKTMLTRYPCPEISRGHFYLEHGLQTYAIPLYASRVSAGYPMPADDFIERRVHLDRQMIKRPASTFLVIASGDSMVNAGIESGDMLLIDSMVPAANGRIVVAAVDGELTVKRLAVDEEGMSLLPENPDYSPIPITPEQHVVIWGVVTLVLAKTPVVKRHGDYDRD